MLPRHARTGEDPAPCPLQPKETMPIFRSGELFFSESADSTWSAGSDYERVLFFQRLRAVRSR
jgi:hypothetical protein